MKKRIQLKYYFDEVMQYWRQPCTSAQYRLSWTQDWVLKMKINNFTTLRHWVVKINRVLGHPGLSSPTDNSTSDRSWNCWIRTDESEPQTTSSCRRYCQNYHRPKPNHSHDGTGSWVWTDRTAPPLSQLQNCTLYPRPKCYLYLTSSLV